MLVRFETITMREKNTLKVNKFANKNNQKFIPTRGINIQ